MATDTETKTRKPRGPNKPKIRLTEARVRDAAVGEYADEVEQGLVLYVSATARTWGLSKWSPVEKRPVKKAIGSWPLIGVDEARRRCKALSLKLLDGASLTRKDKITLDELTKKYIAWNKTRDLKHPEWPRRVIDLGYPDWLERDVSTITRADIAERHLKHATERGRIIAARSVQCLRTLFKFADDNELYVGRNVAKAVRVTGSSPRRRFLSPDEQARVFKALDDPSLAEWVKPFMLLAFATGARRANLAAMRWDMLDLDAGVYRVAKADSKNKIPMEIVLTPEAVAILKERREKVTSEWVFPSPKAACGHLVEPWYAVQQVYEIAKVEDATLHDARRTLGSMLTQAGAPLTTVQRALNHKNPATTARTYSISSDASVREFMAKLNAVKAPQT
jgi:integrase